VLIDVDVAVAGPVKVKAFNLAGELVCVIADTDMGNGRHVVPWNGRNAAGDPVAAGVYFVLVEVPGGFQKRFLVGVLK
jgi:flagellar hook assembly protein FlgD